jgi:hypothetical protein
MFIDHPTFVEPEDTFLVACSAVNIEAGMSRPNVVGLLPD